MPPSRTSRPSPRRACAGRGAHAARAAARGRRARRPASRVTSSSSSRRIAPTSSGSATRAEPGRAEQIGGDPLGRDERQHRPLGRQVLEDLAREDAQPAAAGARDEEQERVGAPSSRRAPGRAAGSRRCEATRPARASRPIPRSAVRKPPTNRASTRSRSSGRSASRPLERLEERARAAHAEEEPGVEDPQRSDGVCSRPANSSKSQPFEITAVGVPAGASARASSAIVSVTAVSAETRANVRRAMRLEHGPLGAHRAALVAAVRVGEPGVAQVGDPWDAGAARHDVPDHVRRRRRRRREDDARRALAHDPHGRPRGVRHPHDPRIGKEQLAPVAGRPASPPR